MRDKLFECVTQYVFFVVHVMFVQYFYSIEFSDTV